MKSALGPTKVSSASTVPAILTMVPFCMARRMRCNKNQAVFCVIPNARWISQEELPFLALAISQKAQSHLCLRKIHGVGLAHATL